MPIESLTITDYPPFRPATFTFSPGVTVIAGPNGVGKTRLLIPLGFKTLWPRQQPKDPGSGVVVKNRRREEMPSPKPYDWREAVAPALTSITLHPSTLHPTKFNEDMVNSIQPFVGANLSNVEGFQNWLHSMKYHVSNTPISASLLSYQQALPRVLDAFSLLDKNVRFSHFDSRFRVILNTPLGEVLLDDMSTGYQAAHSFLFAILRNATDGAASSTVVRHYPDHKEGCILIDEIDRHLHPSWQERIIGILKELLPGQQLIVTTHSPHIIQGLNADELIVLERDDEQLTVQRQIRPAPGSFGFRGWTVEEILRDVMGMDDTISTELSDTVKYFKTAVRARNLTEAEPYFLKLMQMLHPRNDLRLMYQMEFEAIGGQA